MANTKKEAKEEAIIGGFGDSHTGTLEELKEKTMSGKGGDKVPAPITRRETEESARRQEAKAPDVTLDRKPEEVR